MILYGAGLAVWKEISHGEAVVHCVYSEGAPNAVKVRVAIRGMFLLSR